MLNKHIEVLNISICYTCSALLEYRRGEKMNKKITLIILAIGVFGIINTEMGVVGILPLLAKHFSISITEAGWFVSLFALAVAFAGPIMPLLFSGVNRKTMMLMVLSIFLVSNLIQAFTTNFYIALLARVIPAFFQPVYVSLAFSVAASTANSELEVPKSVSKVMLGVSAGMVLGVPVVSFLASTISLYVAMLSFALVNGIVLIVTALILPSMPVSEKTSYGEQISIIKSPLVWISIIAVIFLNGSIFGVYSYFAEYMTKVSGFSGQMVSVLLLLYGLANMIGNVIAGNQLSRHPVRFVLIFPLVLIALYLSLLLLGKFMIFSVVITMVWGILAGAGANINQYWITSVVVKAPDFGNGLFLAATNLGTTIGTMICGIFITIIGISYILTGGILLLVFALISILFRTTFMNQNRAGIFRLLNENERK